jgi:hypothetical protein
MFKVTTPSLYLTSAGYLAELGFAEGASPPFAGPFQKWIWETDELPILSREFRLMSEKIDRSASHGS